ncbi:MAG: hypothetical protein Q4D87_01400 [Actinomycetaceae bacterium]|nr:hypothetical protein [Actinomycetaceae bacterium]
MSGLTASQSLVLFELARLADARGVAICGVDHLVSATGLARRSVFYALRGLESRGVLYRQARYRQGHKAASRFALVWHGGASVVAPQPSVVEDVWRQDGGFNGQIVPVSVDDNEGLRSVLVQASCEGWDGVASQCLAVTLREVGAYQFAKAVARGVEFSSLSWSHAVADTCGVAWEVARTCTDELVSARRPWALWTTIVTRRVLSRDGAERAECLTDPLLMPEVGERPGEGSQADTWVSVDDFEGPLERMVDALMAAGMSETLAWAGTRRVAELALSDSTRRHKAAGLDPRLADLGVSEQAGRAWMTMLVGSRRGAKAGLLDLDDESLRVAAREVVDLIENAA